MRFPKVHRTIKRRLLVNFRLDPVIMQRHVPPAFNPKLHRGYAIAGLGHVVEDGRPCLSRLALARASFPYAFEYRRR